MIQRIKPKGKSCIWGKVKVLGMLPVLATILLVRQRVVLGCPEEKGEK